MRSQLMARTDLKTRISVTGMRVGRIGEQWLFVVLALVVLLLRNPAMAADQGACWTSIGPTRIDTYIRATGRLQVIAIDPSDPLTIYTGSEGCGLWKTTTGGSSWYPTADSLPTLDVRAVAVAPSAPSTVYIATGIGIFRSYDGGGSWSQIYSNSLNTSGITRLLVHPTNPGLLYLATKDGVYRSKTGGQSWSPSLMGGWATGLIMNPSSPNILYAGLGAGEEGSATQGTFVTSNGGDSWNPVSLLPSANTNIIAINLALCQGAANTIYALYRKGQEGNFSYDLYRTTNFAVTWSKQSSPAMAAGGRVYFEILDVAAADPNTVYLAGINFYRSDNGGIDFVEKPGVHVDHHGLARDTSSATAIFTVCDGGIYRSPNRADTWNFIGEGIANVEFYDMAHAATAPAMIIGGTQDNGVIRYSSGTVWYEIGGFGDGGRVAINPSNENTVYAASTDIVGGSNPPLGRSTDGGFNWTDIVNGLPGGETPCPFLSHWQIHPSIPATLLACCQSLWRKTSPGSAWSVLFAPATGTVVRSAVDASVDLYYAGTSDGRLYAGPSGGSWQNVFTSSSSSAVNDIQVDLNDPETIYVALAAPATERVHRLRRSSPAPTSMSDQKITADLPPGLEVQTLTVDGRAALTIYVGTKKGVYRGSSSNAGATWSWIPYAKGMPAAVDVRKLEFHQASGFMRAATYGRSAYEANLNFPLWVEFGYGGFERGTFAQPYNTFGNAVCAIRDGGTLNIKAGSTPEAAVITKAMKLQAYGGSATIGRR